MQWNEESLSKLPLSGGYRLRGEAMTRIEVFSDAAFAFAVTMLVISLSAIPRNYEELILAIKGIPAFAVSFAVIMVLWVAHRRWSRRFGLDDGMSTFLTLALIFVILVYVYPLRIMINILFFAMSGGWFPSHFVLTQSSDVAGLVVFYGVGFFLVSSIQLGLYLRVAARKKELCLSRLEQILVKEEQRIWLVQAVVALLAASCAAIFMHSWGYLSGCLLGLTPILIPLATMSLRKQRKALQKEETSSEDESG